MEPLARVLVLLDDADELQRWAGCGAALGLDVCACSTPIDVRKELAAGEYAALLCDVSCGAEYTDRLVAIALSHRLRVVVATTRFELAVATMPVGVQIVHAEAPMLAIANALKTRVRRAARRLAARGAAQ